MANYYGKSSGLEIYENVEIEDYNLTLHGYEETEGYNDGSEELWFCVEKAFIEVDLDNKTYYAEASNKFISALNKNAAFRESIVDQIKEGL